MPRVAINGFGRIGRNVLRAIYERNLQNKIEVVALNDLGSSAINAHLLKYDTVHGTFAHDVSHDDNSISVAGKEIKILAERNPADLPWAEMNVDIVFECTGLFVSKEKASLHLDAGAKNVLISAPGKEVDLTVVYGVNHNQITSEHKVISNASCTTNCLAPMTWALHKEIGVETGLMNTIHAYTNDQRVTDSYHSDTYRARAAAHNMIPTKTGAAAAIGLVIPELKGKLDGFAVRVPTINVSCLDFTFKPKRATTVEEVNKIIVEAANGELKGILAYNDLPLVSSDFNHNPASCIFDANNTRVIGDQVKVLAWYDNEWGFSNRMLDTTQQIYKVNN